MHREKFGKYPLVLTAEVSYNQGYKSGFGWTHSYRPGGPWVVRASDSERRPSADQDWIKYCDATVENNKEWLRGFDDGLKAQKEQLT